MLEMSTLKLFTLDIIYVINLVDNTIMRVDNYYIPHLSFVNQTKIIIP